MILNAHCQLAVTAYGLQTVAGTSSSKLLTEIISDKSGVTKSYRDKVEFSNNGEIQSSFTIPIVKYRGIKADFRMYLILQEAILNATNHLLLNKLENKKHLLFIVLPASIYYRSEFINTDEWKKFLTDGLDRFTDLHFYFLNANDNVTKHLLHASRQLLNGKLNSIIFSGIDSLVNDQTYIELMSKKRLFQSKTPTGVIPGEAAAAVIIQKVGNNTPSSLALLDSLAHTEQSVEDGNLDMQNFGLCSVIASVSNISGINRYELDCVIRNSITDYNIEVEWMLTKHKLWPSLQKSKNEILTQHGNVLMTNELNTPNAPEEYVTSKILGEVGAASIPLSLVLACARFNSKYQYVNTCLVCEVNEFPVKGAILLQNPATKKL